MNNVPDEITVSESDLNQIIWPKVINICEKMAEIFSADRLEAYKVYKSVEKEIKLIGDKLPFWFLSMLAETCRSALDMETAELWYNIAASKEPDDFLFWLNFASFYLVTGRAEESFSLYRKKLNEVDNRIGYLQIYQFMLHYCPGITREELFDLHKEWGRLVSEQIKPRKIEFKLKRSGKIRVGYVSQDFKRHSVAFYISPLIKCHDRDRFEVYGYGNVREPDFVTEKFSAMFDVYRDISSISDDEICDLIIDDKIDILVDLSGHSGGGRLLVFAQKPAPIQVTYLGYPDTTGLETMDYRITDRIAESEDCADYHVEHPVFVPGGFLCYQMFGNMPEISDLPARENGYVTFGSFNNVRKVNPYIVSLWSKILRSVEGSKMILKFEGGDREFIRNRFCRMFESNGVSSDRLELYGHLPDIEHFDLYNRIDIALDSYPYHGTTTTCEAMWMGVPVVSLIGNHHASRVGASLLKKVGLEYFAAKTEQEYVSKSTALAGDIVSLRKIRASMRGRMAISGLCDGAGFTKKIEGLYEKMISDWEKVNDSRCLKDAGS